MLTSSPALNIIGKGTAASRPTLVPTIGIRRGLYSGTSAPHQLHEVQWIVATLVLPKEPFDQLNALKLQDG